ncbi:MAG: SH3 domain-containing protein [Leptospiraceae bacterium]|nr:SH3 domain-containing protein [Leptospiraceae bacterium]
MKNAIAKFLIFTAIFFTVFNCGEKETQKQPESTSTETVYEETNETSNEENAGMDRKYKKMYVTAKSGLVIREQPDTKARKIRVASYNTSVLVMQEGKEETIAGKTGKWMKIDDGDGVGYWGFGGFLSEKRPEPPPTKTYIAKFTDFGYGDYLYMSFTTKDGKDMTINSYSTELEFLVDMPKSEEKNLTEDELMNSGGYKMNPKYAGKWLEIVVAQEKMYVYQAGSEEDNLKIIKVKVLD